MSFDRRIDENRVVIDGVLFLRAIGQATRSCAICEATLVAGEDHYVPACIAAQRKLLVNGRRTRLCSGCVDERLKTSPRRAS